MSKERMLFKRFRGSCHKWPKHTNKNNHHNGIRTKHATHIEDYWRCLKHQTIATKEHKRHHSQMPYTY